MDVKFNKGQSWRLPDFALDPSVLTEIMSEEFSVPGYMNKN
jgi:hypothetical protein